MLPIFKSKNFIMPKMSEQRLEIIINSKEVPESLKMSFKRFYNKYHTLANFMIFIKP